jgi:phosphatidylglycerophosphate synthase
MTNYTYKTILIKFSDTNKDLLIKLIIEPLATFLTLFIQRTQISANQITFFNLIISSIFLSLSYLINFKLIVLGIYIFFIIDFIDGKIARIKKQNSFEGKRLDFLVDRTVFISFSIYIFFFQQINHLYEENVFFFIYVILYLSKDLYEHSSKILNFELKKNIKYSQTLDNKISFSKYFFNFKNFIPTRVSSPLTIILIYFISKDLILAYQFGCLAIYAKNLSSLIKNI